MATNWNPVVWVEKQSWSDLRKLTQNPISRSSTIWLAVVPLAVTVLRKMPPEVVVPVPGRPDETWFTLVIGLPFSWSLLFFGSLAVAVSRSVFAWKCPRLLRDYGTLGEFQRATDRRARFLRASERRSRN